MSEQIAEFLAIPIVSVWSLDHTAVHHVPASSPRSWYDITMSILPVHQGVLHAGIPGAHKIMQHAAGSCDEADCHRRVGHCGHEDLEPVGQYSERVFHHTARAREPIVEYALIVVEVPTGVRLHHVRPQSESVVS